MASLFKPRAKLVAEILVLRQQLNVLRRQVSKRFWGAPHIHGELLKLGFTIAQSTVARYMYRGCPPSQGWRTFLTNHVDGIAAIDLFVLPTITHQVEEAPPIWDSALMGEAIGCIAACALNEAVTQREKETGVPPSAEMLEYSNWTLLAQGRKLDLMTAPNDGRSGATPWLFRFELFHRDPTAWLRW